MKKIGNTILTSFLSKALLLLVVFISQLGFSQKEFVVSASVLKDTVGYYDVVTVRFETNNNEASFNQPRF
jgi:5-hydroxyisourate hydrolase-like protein (transthyretin family)